jgi:UDP-2,3-diacylglucosamine pyrophosphatase LpxH
MTFAFDLISDLHVETWDSFDWAGQPTSPYCVVAGDVSRDHDQVAQTLEHLNNCYAGVFYIDGNDEHRYQLEDLAGSYRSLKNKLKKLDGVVYLQDNVVIINGVAILATNGWWSYDFDTTINYEESQAWYQEYTQSSQSSADAITGIAYHDAADKYNILPTTIRTMVALKYIDGRNGLLREASLLHHLRTRANARLLKRVPTHLLENTAEIATT